jgi:hypothetical protein
MSLPPGVVVSIFSVRLITIFEKIQCLDEIFERASQPVEFPYDHGVAWAHKRQQPLQSFSLKLRSRHFVTEVFFTSCFFQRILLSCFILLLLGDTSVANLHKTLPSVSLTYLTEEKLTR